MNLLDSFKKNPHTLVSDHFVQVCEFLFLNLGAYLGLYDPVAATPNLKEFILHSWLETHLKTTPLITTRPVFGQEIDENHMTWIHIYARVVMVLFIAIFPTTRMCLKRFMAPMGLDFEALIRVLQDLRYVNFTYRKADGKNEGESNIVYLIFSRLKEKASSGKKADGSKPTNFLSYFQTGNQPSKNVANFLKGKNVSTVLICETSAYLVIGLILLGFGFRHVGFVVTPEQAERIYPKNMYARIFNKEVKFYSIIQVYFYWAVIFKYGFPLINLSLILLVAVAIIDIVIIGILHFFRFRKLLFPQILSYWATINIDSGIVFEMCEANRIHNRKEMLEYYEERMRQETPNGVFENEGSDPSLSSETEYLPTSSILNSETLKTIASSGRFEKVSNTVRI